MKSASFRTRSNMHVVPAVCFAKPIERETDTASAQTSRVIGSTFILVQRACHALAMDFNLTVLVEEIVRLNDAFRRLQCSYLSTDGTLQQQIINLALVKFTNATLASFARTVRDFPQYLVRSLKRRCQGKVGASSNCLLTNSITCFTGADYDLITSAVFLANNILRVVQLVGRGRLYTPMMRRPPVYEIQVRLLARYSSFSMLRRQPGTTFAYG